MALEKTGSAALAENAYRNAIAANPGLAQAHYNIAVLYWNKDPDRVKSELIETLKIDPSHKEAAYYLKRMRRK